MSMIVLNLSLKLLIFKRLVLNMVLILKLWLIAIEPLLLKLMFLKKRDFYFRAPGSLVVLSFPAA
jgi:hypothetical protein